MFAPLYENSKGHWNRYVQDATVRDIGCALHVINILEHGHRTIHGMVYNAMKLFMEINPTLFDECTSAYAADQESAPQRLSERENVWKMLEDKAAANRKPRAAEQDGKNLSLSSQSQQVVRGGSPMQITDDSGAGDSQRQMDALNIQDEGTKVVGVA